jgi:photosystem II stability/assembly factor-like uncharacterized protein
MKRSFVFVPATLIVALLLTSFFVLNGDEIETKAGKSESAVKRSGKAAPVMGSLFTPPGKLAEANIVYKSTDGGQSWQDITLGLPLDQQNYDIRKDKFFTTDKGLFLSAGDGIYHSEPYSASGVWKKEASLYKAGSIAPGKSGIYSYNYQGKVLQKKNGTNEWSPRFANFKGEIHTIFESASGAVFIASHNGLFRSTNSGETWNQVYAGRCMMELAESDGVLLASSNVGIFRSADGGESWTNVIREGGVGIEVEAIKGGFAAIAFNTKTNTRRIHLSNDAGKTWSSTLGDGFRTNSYSPDFKTDGFKASMNISSIKQVGNHLMVGHPEGVIRSSDMGKTWKLLLPSVKNKVFTLSVAGGAIYAIAVREGC